jgi:hypothetical protein
VIVDLSNSSCVLPFRIALLRQLRSLCVRFRCPLRLHPKPDRQNLENDAVVVMETWIMRRTRRSSHQPPNRSNALGQDRVSVNSTFMT